MIMRNRTAGWMVTMLLVTTFVVGSAGSLSAEKPSDSTPAMSVDVLTFTARDGETYFTLPLTVAPVGETRPGPSDIAVLIDTSASQVGAHRVQALGVLESFLSTLSDGDRVQLFAVDVRTTPLSPSLSPPRSDAVKAAVATLNRRPPLGATRLLPALKQAAAVLEASDRARIVYIGDGMSVAGLIDPKALAPLVTALRDSRISVHCYGVGSRVDIEVLGVLALQTGGTVEVDQGC